MDGPAKGEIIRDKLSGNPPDVLKEVALGAGQVGSQLGVGDMQAQVKVFLFDGL